jgi:hypothetical protein
MRYLTRFIEPIEDALVVVLLVMVTALTLV